MATSTHHDDCEALVQPAGRRSPTRSAAAAVAAAVASAVGVALLVGGTTLVLGGGGAAAAPATSAPMTARALLQSGEVCDATTDNLMALHGAAVAPLGRAAVRERVARSLASIDTALEQVHPAAHRRLGEIVLSPEEKHTALKALRPFGDARMVDATHAVLEEMKAASVAGADAAAVKRRLTDRLAPKFADLAQVSAEMAQGQPIPLASGPASALGKWHPTVEVDLGSPRRLEALDDVAAGVNSHAHALFHSLEGALGEKMPKAPARMLQSQSQYGSTTGGGQESFMDCVQEAVPDPSKVVGCFVSHMSEVLTMVKSQFHKLTSR